MQTMEDNFADVVAKSQRGLQLSDAELASRAGISRGELAEVKEENYDAAVLRKLAPVLQLNAEALAALPDYRPAPVEVRGLAVFTTRYGGIDVNAYIVFDKPQGVAMVFDTGANVVPMLDFLEAQNLELCVIFITHAHRDHFGDLDRLREGSSAPAWISKREYVSGIPGFEDGQDFECGPFQIEARLTRGHTRGGTSYLVRGLERPVIIVGDALFAGSMGGAMVSYADALQTNRENILALPPETVICPGHGPLTTVAEERVHNPFFA